MERIRELIAKGYDQLTTEELAELDELLQGEAERLNDDDLDVTDELIEEMKFVRDSIKAVRQEASNREAAEAERKKIADELRKEISGQDDPDDPDADTEPEAEPEPAKGEEPVPVAAAATKPARRAPGATRRPKETAPKPNGSNVPALVASANLPNINAGSDLSNPDHLADAFRQMYLSGIGYMGARTRMPVASVVFNFPEDRVLDDNAEANEAKLRSVTSHEAITAAGGICAPAPIEYDLPTLGSTARPVRDALPNFGATRGAVRTIRPPTIADVGTNAVTIWTAANDITPSAPATKPCLTVTCGSDDTTSVDAIVECLRAGNFMDRYFRERIDAFLRLVGVWAARTAEQALITKIAAGSTTFTTGTVLGTTRDVLAAFDRHLAAVRYYYRLDGNERIRVLGPRWALDNMRTDLARELPGSTAERLATADADIERFFAARGLNITWIMEGETSQRFAAPAAGGVQPWPSTMFFYVFPEGSWTYLNGGRLDLGQVRDSTLNGVNDFQLFAETFEQVHFHGTWSHKLNIDTCPNGQTSAAATVNVCTTGS